MLRSKPFKFAMLAVVCPLGIGAASAAYAQHTIATGWSGLPGSVDSYATGINDSGQVVGYSLFLPEPSTWAMMLLGFAGLGFVGYRRARALETRLIDIAHALPAILLLLWLFAGPVLAAPPHPLDPLTAGELASLKTILESSGAFSANTYFAWIELQEPTKELVKQYIPNAFFPRMVHLSAVDYEKKTSFSVAVDLQARQITSVVDLKDLQPGMTKRDVEIATGILDNDPQVRAALLRRGLNIPGRLSDSVKMLNETIGDDPSLSNIHSRLMRVLFLSDHVVRLVDEPGEPIRKVPHDGPQDLCHKLRCTIHR